ncbi:hypothetical protein PHLGIDRAFT_347915 [Phlebiopsis gigantea 11061_1 CR5-6]|uniref:Zn(2)-C6 fungal-type domain-containing protein n=1 Tax=Phlebiopsis gigantea (strain 11061_1 CR5-6) TaxID=745531 RepID=A0A0C3NUX4_PHLG1|nr:hypothetical protein PHLGIDRAFT_347915 [Phlebiopsis gigantea 11061_1 CR5-6]
MARTCMACRARKMRCDGETPVCGPCSRARKPVECTYTDTTAIQRKAALLQKGAACLPCRRKKKKCDAERPYCNTCHAAGKEAECGYDEEVRENLTIALLSRNRELEERLALYEARGQRMSQPPTALIDASLDRAIHLEWPPEISSSLVTGTANDSPSISVGELSSSSSDSSPSSHSTSSLNNFARSLLSDIAPRPSQGTGLICQNTFELRSLFLNHQTQIGFYLREAKWQAVKNGDFSGLVVHRGLVHLSQLLGSLLWRIHHKTEVLVLSEAVEMQNLLNALEYPPDPATLVMMYTVLAWYHLYERKLEIGRQYLSKAVDVIMLNNLQFAMQPIDVMLSLEEPDENTKEYLTSMCQLLYMDKAAKIVLQMAPLMDATFDTQFRTLTFIQPWLSKRSVVIMRCKSIILLQDCMRLSRMRADAMLGSTSRILEHTALPPEWYTQYWETLEDVTQHVALLYPQMLQASLCADPRHGLCLKVCIIVALAAQVELHRMPGSYHAESRQKSLSAILEVITLTKGLKGDDYDMLEPILGICFTIVANALRGDHDLLLEISTQGTSGNSDSDERDKEAFSVLIDSATRLSTKLPYVENALRTLHDIASNITSNTTPNK